MKSLHLLSGLSFFLATLSIWGIGSNFPLQGNQIQAQPGPTKARSGSPALLLVYPPPNHETTASRIFLIGSAPVGGDLEINGIRVGRSPRGYFAPSFPLQMGTNQFTIRYHNQTVQLTVNRRALELPPPVGVAFAANSLTPTVDLARLPNEPICFAAIAPANATVSVKLADQVVPLAIQTQAVNLPANQAVLTQQNQPQPAMVKRYEGCVRTVILGDLGQPEYQLSLNQQTATQKAAGSIRILSPVQIEIAEVVADVGAARTGPSTDYSRLTPLPRGTQASVTGYEGDWVRLDYGAWIKRQEVRISKASVPPTSLIRSIRSRQLDGQTEIVFPLQVPVPVSVQQGDRTFTLTLFNTTAQTDIIQLNDDPLIARLDWQQVQPGQVQYTFNLKTAQQWGYTLRYEGTSLILTLRHPPKATQTTSTTLRSPRSLSGVTILLDPGHGGPEDLGSRGPTGLPEKSVTLTLSKLLQKALQQRGAKVVLTRTTDVDVSLQDRVALINQVKPTVALSLHYNALPDEGDAIKTQGISTFWYNTQAHGLAVYLHNYLTLALKRPSYGVFWNNLALTRPTIAPSVLLELGFMINPTEFEWVTDPREQQRLARAIADGLSSWLQQAL
ncbi:MAG: N-acetylmuramoyl-L-alanine amidase [Leptolyngbyaceae cyanobacterium]